MSAFTTPNDSPVQTQPMHNPSLAAHIVHPQAPLGNATNGFNPAPGMGAKALLAKRMAKNINPTFISPTDNLMTPCTQKISAAKKKNFSKGAKPMQPLFKTPEEATEPSSSDEEPTQANKMDDDENPF